MVNSKSPESSGVDKSLWQWLFNTIPVTLHRPPVFCRSRDHGISSMSSSLLAQGPRYITYVLNSAVLWELIRTVHLNHPANLSLPTVGTQLQDIVGCGHCTHPLTAAVGSWTTPAKGQASQNSIVNGRGTQIFLNGPSYHMKMCPEWELVCMDSCWEAAVNYLPSCTFPPSSLCVLYMGVGAKVSDICLSPLLSTLFLETGSLWLAGMAGQPLESFSFYSAGIVASYWCVWNGTQGRMLLRTGTSSNRPCFLSQPSQLLSSPFLIL